MKYKHVYISFSVILALFSCNKEREITKEYWPNGSGKTICTYLSEDTSTYLRREFYQDGKLKSQNDYSNNLKNGEEIFWNNDGSKWGEGIYEKGQVKFQRLYFPNGSLKSSESIIRLDTISYDTLVDGISGFVMSVGNAIEWYENGKIKTQKILLSDTSYLFKYWGVDGSYHKEEYVKNGYTIKQIVFKVHSAGQQK